MAARLLPPDEAWKELLGRFPSRDLSVDGDYYAIPGWFVKRIQRNIPDLFSKEDAEFERALASATRGGFFQGHAFSYPRLLLGSDFGTNPDARLLDDSQELLDQFARDRGHTADAIVKSKQAAKSRDDWVARVATAFVCWLVFNPEFRRQRSAFRKAWESYVRKHGFIKEPSFLAFGRGKSREIRLERHSLEFVDSFDAFRQRWCLDTMLTWDLPIPWMPNLGEPDMHDPVAAAPFGVMLHLPWYSLRMKSLPIQEFALGSNATTIPKELIPWISRVTGEGGIREGRSLIRLYAYFELAIRARYGDRLKGCIGKLDGVFADYVEIQADMVKRLRSKLRGR